MTKKRTRVALDEEPTFWPEYRLDLGFSLLVLICRLEAKSWHARLTTEPDEDGHLMPMSFIRAVHGATVLDGWARHGLVQRPAKVMVDG